MFEEEFMAHPELYDERDYRRICANEWWTKRYLLYRQHNLQRAFEQLKSNMKWRKERDVWSITGMVMMFTTDSYLALYAQ